MRDKARHPESSLGQLLIPDYSGEDLGQALHGHVLDVATIFRAAKVCAEHEADIHDVEELVALGLDMMDAITEGYEIAETDRRKPGKVA